MPRPSARSVIDKDIVQREKSVIPYTPIKRAFLSATGEISAGKVREKIFDVTGVSEPQSLDIISDEDCIQIADLLGLKKKLFKR